MAGAQAGLLARLQAQRTGRVQVGAPGSNKVLLVLRPLEAQMGAFRRMTADAIIGQVIGWEGITEADLLPAGIGASTEVPFERAVADEALHDRLDWVGRVSDWLAESIQSHLAAREAARKN